MRLRGVNAWWFRAAAALLSLLASVALGIAQPAWASPTEPNASVDAQQLRDALRTRAGEAPQRIRSPDYLERGPGESGKFLVSYGLRADLGAAPRAVAILSARCVRGHADRRQRPHRFRSSRRFGGGAPNAAAVPTSWS